MEDKVLEILAAGCMGCLVCAAVGQLIICCVHFKERRVSPEP
tara:strand:+ start:589 stop:714 length:126 start_codon:yes stop_codon:yes gene_type:complete